MSQGGLRVNTTIDLKKQAAARKAISGRLAGVGPSSAIVTIDPRNGYIKAMASSADYGKSKFNLAAQGHRQPGSTFKVMVLMTALRKGVDPNSTTYDSHHLAKGWLKEAPDYEVKTYDGSQGGRMDIVKATLKSDNTVYAQLIADLGPEEVKQTAYDLGIKTHLNGYYAEGLGGLRLGVSPLEMANAYATIADGGYRNRPTAITKVVFPDGHSDLPRRFKVKRTKAFEDGVTYEATKILEANIKGGTGTKAQIGCPAGGKTGTTDEHSDAWFVGFTPRLSSAVWVGYPDSQVHMKTEYHGAPVAGGTFPAEIWGDYMKAAKGSFCGDFAQPVVAARFTPFFGKHARTGPDRSDQGGTLAPADPNKKDGKNGGKQQAKGKGKNYNPDLYESPPQAPPATQPPPVDPGGGAPAPTATPVPGAAPTL